MSIYHWLSLKFQRLMLSEIIGILLYVTASLVSVILLGISKYIFKRYDISPIDLLCVRSIICLIIFMPLIISYRKQITPTNIVMNFKRDFFVILTTAIWYTLAPRVPMNNATTISFMSPIFSVIGAYFIISEKPNKYIWFGLMIGIIGVIIGLKPDFSDTYNIIWWIYLGIMLNAMLRAIVNVTTKIVANIQPIRIILCNHMIILAVFYSITLLPFLNFTQIISALPIIIIFSMIYCLYAVCYHFGIDLAGVSLPQPFDFIRLPFSILISYFFFGERITLYNIIGGLIVVISYFFLKKVNNKISD